MKPARSAEKGGPPRSHPHLRLVESEPMFKAARLYRNVLAKHGQTVQNAQGVIAALRELEAMGVDMTFIPSVQEEAEKLDDALATTTDGPRAV